MPRGLRWPLATADGGLMQSLLPTALPFAGRGGPPIIRALRGGADPDPAAARAFSVSPIRGRLGRNWQAAHRALEGFRGTWGRRRKSPVGDSRGGGGGCRLHLPPPLGPRETLSVLEWRRRAQPESAAGTGDPKPRRQQRPRPRGPSGLHQAARGPGSFSF